MFRTIATAIAFTAFIAAAPALAESAPNWSDAPEGSIETMDTRGVDFNDPSAIRAFYTKMRYAAARVCATQHDERTCKKEALSDAVRQVNQPQLSLHHEEKTGERDTQLALNASSR